jgi:hypothetical protein
MNHSIVLYGIAASLLSSTAFATGTTRIIWTCTKEAEPKVKSFFMDVYNQIYTNLKADSEKKAFEKLVNEQAKKIDPKSPQSSPGLSQDSLSKIAQFHPHNNESKLITRFQTALGRTQISTELKSILKDYPSPNAAGMAFIAQCRDPEGIQSGWDKTKANVYLGLKEFQK